MAKTPETLNPDDEYYSDEETARRRDKTLKRMLDTPPKSHAEIAGKDKIVPPDEEKGEMLTPSEREELRRVGNEQADSAQEAFRHRKKKDQ